MKYNNATGPKMHKTLTKTIGHWMIELLIGVLMSYKRKIQEVIETVNVVSPQPLSPKELWHIVHQCYGTELGLTSEDDDYVSPTDEHINGLLWVYMFAVCEKKSDVCVRATI